MTRERATRTSKPFAWLACVFVMAFAQTAVATCTLGVTDVTFGEYDIFESLDSNITGSVSVSCDSDTTLQVTLGAGSGTFSARKMLNGTSTLLYNLFLDPAHLTLWGDGSPGTGLLGLSGSGGTYTIYGRIPARQNVPAGLYTDSIVVSLTF
jgi:spore coat protein U domain-containing protein, fimbrial subunit CupE1/2/3/6